MAAADLPEDIINEEILVRLPAKSLTRFKAVSKAWCKLIQTTDFQHKHLKRGAKLKMMIEVFQEFPELITSHLCVVDLETFDEYGEEPDFSWFSASSDLRNSCNGLFLVVGCYHRLKDYIWNPITGERYVLPKLKTNCKFSPFSRLFGFGYDSVTGYYKVFCALYGDEQEHKDEWSLYRQQTDSWERLNNVPYRPCHSTERSVLFLENNLHFLADPRVIVAFDLSNEEFREVARPDHLGDDEFMIASDYCCLYIVSHLKGPVIHVWAMKEYGNQESWIKMFLIKRDTIIPYSYLRLYLVHVSVNGEMLVFATRKHFVLYNTLEKKGRIFERIRPVFHDHLAPMSYMYLESLVTFKGDVGDISRVEKSNERRVHFKFVQLNSGEEGS